MEFWQETTAVQNMQQEASRIDVIAEASKTVDLMTGAASKTAVEIPAYLLVCECPQCTAGFETLEHSDRAFGLCCSGNGGHQRFCFQPGQQD